MNLIWRFLLGEVFNEQDSGSEKCNEKKYNKLLFPLSELKAEDIPEAIRDKIDGSLFNAFTVE